MMYSVCRARASAAVSRLAHSQRATAARALVAAAHSHSTFAITPLAASSSALGSTVGATTGGVAARSFSAAAGASGTATPATAGGEDDEGRPSAPADSNSQGPADDTQNAAGAGSDTGAASKKKPSILDVDPYPPEKMAALEKKYGWVDFNAMAQHLHMADVHFFDQEVPYVDQDFTIKPDFRLSHRLDSANRLKRLQEQEDKKIHRLLHFGYWVTSGRNTRVATEGKIQSVWTMVVGGDMNGTASFGFGKGEDMILAEKRALQDLRRNMLFVPMFESRTISHEIRGRHGVCQVRMWPRPRERGMTAGLIPRMIFECFGLQDITAKVDGRALPHHQAMAIFNGLREVKSLREEAIRRGVTAHRMFERGLQQPRHPGRAALAQRGAEVGSLLREVRAMQTHENMLQDLEVVSEDDPSRPKFFSYPEFGERGAEADTSGASTFVPAYIVRKPEPLDVGPRTPSPRHPTGRKPAIKETLMRYRGLPHPRTPQTEKTRKVM